MDRLTKSAAELLVCPDDRGDLTVVENHLTCGRCHRSFKVWAPNLVEVLPLHKTVRVGQSRLERRNIGRYEKIFDEKFTWEIAEPPWGLMESLPLRAHGRVLKQLNLIKRVLPDKLGIFCDVSAGSGRYDFELLDRCTTAVYSDLRVADVVHLYRETTHRAASNVLIVRCDYWSSPYRGEIFDTVLCNDTLIYGLEHERRLLETIYGSLKNGGTALVDFHNRMHSGIWHAPYEIGYTIREIKRLLNSVGIDRYELFSYYQEEWISDGASYFKNLLTSMVPPTRYFVKIVKSFVSDENPALP